MSRRELLPATDDVKGKLHQLESQPSQQGSPSKKRKRVTAACEGCRERKNKCSGERPTCGECRSRDFECVYDTLPGESRWELQKSKKGRMEHDLNTMMELYWYLRTQQPEDVAKALEAIQSGMHPNHIMHQLNPDKRSDDFFTSNRQSSSTISEPSPSSNKTSTAGQPVPELMIQSSKFISVLKSGVEAFFSCTGHIFAIFERSEAEEMLSVVRQHLLEAGDTWPQLIFRGSPTADLMKSLCSVCIMAAIGLQYTKDPIPAMGFEPSSETGTYQYVNIFYQIAKNLLEAVIESDMLKAIKICAAMCVFNTISHATVALANADMGINFALNLGPSLQLRPPGMTEEAWVNYKRVMRTLVTLRCWLITSLGYVAGDNPNLRAVIECLIDQKDDTMAPTEVIQQELAQVVHIEANLLRTLDSFGEICAAVFGSVLKDLNRWHQQLPSWMRLSALTTDSELPTGERRTVFLVHLYYLSAHILVARLAHGRVVDESKPGSYDIKEIRAATGDGLVAARAAAQILQLQLDEQAVFQRCWLCEFTAYMACLVLLHSTAQLLLHNHPAPTCIKELAYAKSCIDVLDHCGSADEVARQFADTTRQHYTFLLAEASVVSSSQSSDFSSTSTDPPQPCAHLFSTPPNSPPHLENAARELLKLVSQPFGYPSNLKTEVVFNTGFGSQLEWNAFVTLPRNQATPKTTNSAPLLELAMSGMQSGKFLGPTRPHGWAGFSRLG